MNITITGRGTKVTPAIKKKVREVLSKHTKLLKKANKIYVELKQSIAHEGVDTDLSVEIMITMPKAIILVEEKGADFYSTIDLIDPILRRRLVRYRDKSEKWEGKKSWKLADVTRFEKEASQKAKDDYSDVSYQPQITRYKQFAQNSPMVVAEAIERMELLGHEAFLFKNSESDAKYSVVYKRRDGTYGLIEPNE